jgi:hypothetical protein
MAIQPSSLKSLLESDWLVAQDGSHSSTPVESGQKFARAVSQWFAAAQANGLPCATAMARQSQLAGQAAAAIQVGQAQGAGAQLALAVASYYAGQSFGPGVATFPAALSAGVSMIGGVFGNLDLSITDRAHQIATACHGMAISTIVAFPNPPFAAAIL